MKFIHENTYHNPSIRFSITKPADWTFMPSEWALNLKEQSFEHTPEFEEMVKTANLPFVHFYRYHAEAQYPCPTVQCGCRLNGGVTLAETLEQVTEELGHFLPTSRFIAATPDYILSGHRSAYCEFTFSVKTCDGVTLECLGRSMIVIRPDLVFTVGLTGSMDEKYRCEAEFAEIVRTIRIGK